MIIAGAVEPGLLALPGHVDDERVAFPAPARPAHPRVGRRLAFPVHPDRAASRWRTRTPSGCTGSFPARSEMETACRSRAGCPACSTSSPDRRAHATFLSLLTSDLHAVRDVLLLLRQRCRLIRDRRRPRRCSARPAIRCAPEELGMQARLRFVILEVDVRGDKRLPHAVEVGVPVGQPRSFVCRKTGARLAPGEPAARRAAAPSARRRRSPWRPQAV